MAAAKGTMPPNAGKGRVKGVKNRVPGLLKDQILQALDEAGGVDYLRRQALLNPGPFLALIGKVLPTQLQHSGSIGDKPLAEMSEAEIIAQLSEARRKLSGA